MGSSRKDAKHFPEDVKDEIGHALWLAQCGEKHITAKPLKGFGGATVLEIIADFESDTTARSTLSGLNEWSSFSIASRRRRNAAAQRRERILTSSENA